MKAKTYSFVVQRAHYNLHQTQQRLYSDQYKRFQNPQQGRVVLL